MGHIWKHTLSHAEIFFSRSLVMSPIIIWVNYVIKSYKVYIIHTPESCGHLLGDDVLFSKNDLPRSSGWSSSDCCVAPCRSWSLYLASPCHLAIFNRQSSDRFIRNAVCGSPPWVQEEDDRKLDPRAPGFIQLSGMIDWDFIWFYDWCGCLSMIIEYYWSIHVLNPMNDGFVNTLKTQNCIVSQGCYEGYHGPLDGLWENPHQTGWFRDTSIFGNPHIMITPLFSGSRPPSAKPWITCASTCELIDSLERVGSQLKIHK